MAAIETYYLGPTKRTGARFKANAGQGRTVTLHERGDFTETQNHKHIALALCALMGWQEHGAMVGTRTARGMVWIFPKHAETINIAQMMAGPLL